MLSSQMWKLYEGGILPPILFIFLGAAAGQRSASRYVGMAPSRIRFGTGTATRHNWSCLALETYSIQ